MCKGIAKDKQIAEVYKRYLLSVDEEVQGIFIILIFLNIIHNCSCVYTLFVRLCRPLTRS